MKTANRSASTATPIDVIVSVVRFKDILEAKAARGGILTEYVMKLARRDPRAFIKGDDLYINRPAPVRFTLTAGSRDRNQYYPLGISFLRQRVPSKSDAQRLGFLNFPQSETRAEGPSLTILDTYRDDAVNVRYKFSLYLQRGSDGAIGVIDPGIDHTGDQ
jgi:hypothetical protein